MIFIRRKNETTGIFNYRGICFADRQLENGNHQVLAEELKAFHRSGQTFVTWKEDPAQKGEQYHIFVSKVPLTKEKH